MKVLSRFLGVLLVGAMVVDCSPPPVQYPYTKLVTTRRMTLKQNLLKLLPAEQQNLPEAKAEAEWLSDTAYKAAAGISRINNSHFPGWSGNALVNSRLQDRGLCWHYQHDLYRELRRRKLSFFRLGCCVRDKAESSEHNCVYIASKDGKWPHVWMLDAWKWNGRLRVEYGPELNQKRWADLEEVTDYLSDYYKEGHAIPIEQWFMVRLKNGKYGNRCDDRMRKSPQFKRMIQNINRGYQEHPNSPVNY
ncbi:MAG: hypothetical protein J1E42_01060 [Akkermansiaceae bacterium]|nr:hypothetical protein [Akkermansiaceae bacterium]